MGNALKLLLGTLWTVGFVICPPPHSSNTQRPEMVSELAEQVALKRTLPDPTPVSAPLNIPNDPALLAASLNSSNQPTRPSDIVSFTPEASAETAPLDLARAGDAPDIARFQQIMQYADGRSLYTRPLGEIMQAIGDQLLGSTYQANLLEQPGKEKLVVSLTRFDCVLFVETVLALARGVALQNYSYQTFTHNLENQRYRDGKLDGYCSRLHYFSEWMTDNQKRGNVLDVATNLGGISFSKMLDFMSKHRSSYPQIANDDTAYRCVQRMEANINPSTISYIPQPQIRKHYSLMQPGDIVAIVTDLPGLDVTHTGLVYRNADGTIGLIHAAPDVGVKVAPDLQAYVGTVEDSIGILVARPIDPRKRVES